MSEDASKARIVGFESEPQIYLFVGAPKSGKSYCIRELMWTLAERKFFGFGKVFSQTSEFNEDYDYIPKEHVCEWDEEKAKKYVDSLKAFARKHGNKKIPQNFIIFDDLLGIIDPYSPFLLHLLAIHRHLKISIFFTSQYLNRNVSTMLRSVCNKAWMWKPEDMNSLTGLYEAFASMHYKDKEFVKFMHVAGQVPYRSLVFARGEKEKGNSFRFYTACAKIPKFNLKYKIKGASE